MLQARIVRAHHKHVIEPPERVADAGVVKLVRWIPRLASANVGDSRELHVLANFEQVDNASHGSVRSSREVLCRQRLDGIQIKVSALSRIAMYRELVLANSQYCSRGKKQQNENTRNKHVGLVKLVNHAAFTLPTK